ncbi:MAG TPA: hypothetical protein VFO39_04805 [Candidatus Sulfotelmatobacter sp.]|nr:hypothetical protein [Candidatus Sulfotelmatobacter sp.]
MGDSIFQYGMGSLRLLLVIWLLSSVFQQIIDLPNQMNELIVILFFGSSFAQLSQYRIDFMIRHHHLRDFPVPRRRL